MFAAGEQQDFEVAADNEDNQRKRKKYHRHTADQIRQLEALFQASPHPDERQRREVSKQLGLHPRQVKFWFQNRRTQIKTIHERNENQELREEINRLRHESNALREIIANSICPKCDMATAHEAVEEQLLRIENARMKAENEKLQAVLGRYASVSPPAMSTCSPGNNQIGNIRSSLDDHSSIHGLETLRIVNVARKATEELIKMATGGEPLWIRSFETGREILNYDEYIKEFSVKNFMKLQAKGPFVEASRDSGIVYMDLPKLVQCFMDVNQWQEMFPCMISKAATIDVISSGDGVTMNGAIQLMFAELQMLTPEMPTRGVYFVRHCKLLSVDRWAIVDVSIDNLENDADARCSKRPSGCIIEDRLNNYSKVIWVEHMECPKNNHFTPYHTFVNSGTAFGASHWMKTLQLQCERLLFSIATNLPPKDSYGVPTLEGRQSVFKLAQRMTRSFYQAVRASNCHIWNRATSKTGGDIRITSRINSHDSGEPIGVVLCAVLSVWLPVPHRTLFNYLRDETRRGEWDVIANKGPAQNIANLMKGQDRGNAVTIQAMKNKDKNMWILQDCYVNAFESTLVYAPVDIRYMKAVMGGCDSSSIAILASGFSIIPNGLESKPFAVSSKPEDKSAEGGSLFTIAFQILTSSSQTENLSMESFESVKSLVSCTLQNIKKALQCEDA